MLVPGCLPVRSQPRYCFNNRSATFLGQVLPRQKMCQLSSANLPQPCSSLGSFQSCRTAMPADIDPRCWARRGKEPCSSLGSFRQCRNPISDPKMGLSMKNNPLICGCAASMQLAWQLPAQQDTDSSKTSNAHHVLHGKQCSTLLSVADTIINVSRQSLATHTPCGPEIDPLIACYIGGKACRLRFAGQQSCALSRMQFVLRFPVIDQTCRAQIQIAHMPGNLVDV